MTDSFMPLMRALVAAALLLATAMLMVVTVNTARAAGALAIGKCGAFGESFDFHSAAAARQNALAKCSGQACRVVASVQRGCAALAIDYVIRAAPMAGARTSNSAAPRTRHSSPATAAAARSASSAPFSATAKADRSASIISI